MKKVIYIFVSSLLIAACAVGPKYSGRETKKPQQYVQAPAQTDSITNLKWWDVYKDEALQKLIEKAVNQNLDVRAAIARVEQSKAALGMSKADYFPQFDYSLRGRATDFRDVSDDAGMVITPYSVSAVGSVSWEIDIWGKIRHANRAAFADLMASEENRKAIYISVVATTAELYFELRGLDERYEITKKTYASRKEFLRIISLRFEQGDVSELDKLQAEQITAESEAQLYGIERSLIRVENALNVMLGQPYQTVIRGLENNQQQLPLEIPAGLPSELLERRPDIQMAEQQLIAQTERIGVAVAMRFPSLSLTGFLGVASPDISDLFVPGALLGSITGQLAGPAFHFQRNKRRVEVERARAEEYGFYYEKTVLNAFAEVENSLAEIRTFGNEYKARETQVGALDKSLELSRALYDNGYTSFLQVLDSERELLSAQYQKSMSLQSQLISTVRLYKALGGGW